MNLGLRIKELRTLHGVSQERLAHDIGMDRSYLASVEAGKRNVSIRNLMKIAYGFRVTLAELLDGVTTSQEYLDDLVFQPERPSSEAPGNHYRVSPFKKR